ncbi:DUF4405 domain-containing protein [candidate division KSB1 bacterium]|nr:DUF4405 domain-containing protein [candidate division KSB1 bacterium]NIR72670.1 DUF4405 domain-containing protein [candidate division KSB1 bacterium]NIS25137.1 DUF4405 domain-containing protein [candidate division KSB1 bacterium]NIT72044.1 DUF4405 domain-containing protein [candidate division KSB1 bacterium]NIU25836.1 DUF4405 domain-containing protein [candidate division KSB1 bacterium]
MNKKNSNKVNWRAFTSIFILLSFLMIGISGIILYFAPPGRVAFWSNWTLITVTKEGWQAVHTIFAFIFVVTAVFHLKFNWKPLTAYIKRKIQEGSKDRKELALSGILSASILILTLAETPPFSTVMTWGEALSNSWANEQTEPPVPHAELMTLTEFAQTVQIPLAEIQERLQSEGIDGADSLVVIKDLANRHNLTPNQLYEKIKTGQAVKPPQITKGSGYGRKSITEVCSELKIPVEDCLIRLQNQGIEATADSNIRELALKHNKSPIDIVSILHAENEKMGTSK